MLWGIFQNRTKTKNIHLGKIESINTATIIHISFVLQQKSIFPLNKLLPLTTDTSTGKIKK